MSHNTLLIHRKRAGCVQSSIVLDGARIRYIHFNECLPIANTAFMDFCGPFVVALLYSMSGLFTAVINARNNRTYIAGLCLYNLPFIAKQFVTSASERCFVKTFFFLTYLDGL